MTTKEVATMNDKSQRVLLVDDDPAVLRAYERVLIRRGWQVETAVDGVHALERLRDRSYDVVVSDVKMQRMGGVALLRAIREFDPDLPVILMTGQPDLDVAASAVEYGAFRFLFKPILPQVLDEALRLATQHNSTARIDERRRGDRARLEARFAMAKSLLWIAYQPIVSQRGHEVFGYEALLRSYEPSMRSAADVLAAAERLGRVPELGRAARARVFADRMLAATPPTLFVNLHALDLNDDELYEPTAPLARVAANIVFEITERASLDEVHGLVARVERLRAMGFRIALDDLGAGYAGLTTYSRIKPDIAKIDMFLVRDIDSDARKQRIVRGLVELCTDLGTIVVAEGVESIAERDALVDLGCDLFQGYLYAKPALGFGEPCWDPRQRFGGTPEHHPMS